MSSYLTSCEKAARAAGKVLTEWRGKFQVREKGRADLVTDADLAAQKAIEEILSGDFPDFEFLGEEGPAGVSRTTGSPFCWIVDPLDGTTNYVHGLPNYSVSIGLAEAGTIIAGVVYDPVFDRCFKAEKGQGATLNDERIEVSRAKSLDEALIAASFAASIQKGSPEIDDFVNVLTQSRGIRRLGSAALNLAYVATGCLDGYWAGSNKPWDVAAGVILVQEAGGIVQGYNNQPFDVFQPKIVATGTQQLQAALQAQISSF
ncbi:inositol monophosphatase family protein [Blastopirellula marina]|uniref:Inositol-1-monophosphatase n=1 Tax=Blastopirellula marina TaxID=124 RepID=A0A2S8FNZ0_9BACT|nr:inositol monophosphatase family protein [Blastopirellula marina]PQO33906.1 inositol monophosphatase [Blastopirellula marina]PTL43693.1 inositol monophosphatase [Blastopirellula marina]